jgi:hypothetical protein
MVTMNELSGLTVCGPGEQAANATCTYDAYNYVTTRGYDAITIGENAACLAAYIVVCHAFGYVAVRAMKV